MLKEILLCILACVSLVSTSCSPDEDAYRRLFHCHERFLSHAQLVYPAMPKALIDLSYKCARGVQEKSCADLVSEVMRMMQYQRRSCLEVITHMQHVVDALQEDARTVKGQASIGTKMYAAFHARLLMIRLSNRNSMSECLRFPVGATFDDEAALFGYRFRLDIKRQDLLQDQSLLIRYALAMQQEVCKVCGRCDEA